MIAVTTTDDKQVVSVHGHLTRRADSDGPYRMEAIVFFDDGSYTRADSRVFYALTDRATEDDYQDGNYIEFNDPIAWSEVVK